MLLGAVIAAYAPSLQMRVTSVAQTPGWSFALALSVLRELDGARHGPRRGLQMAALAASLRTDPLQLEPIVNLLLQIDWVGRLDEGDTARLMLLCDPAATALTALIDRTLLAPGPGSAAFRSHSGLDRLTLAQAL